MNFFLQCYTYIYIYYTREVGPFTRLPLVRCNLFLMVSQRKVEISSRNWCTLRIYGAGARLPAVGGPTFSFLFTFASLLHHHFALLFLPFLVLTPFSPQRELVARINRTRFTRDIVKPLDHDRTILERFSFSKSILSSWIHTMQDYFAGIWLHVFDWIEVDFRFDCRNSGSNR